MQLRCISGGAHIIDVSLALLTLILPVIRSGGDETLACMVKALVRKGGDFRAAFFAEALVKTDFSFIVALNGPAKGATSNFDNIPDEGFVEVLPREEASARFHHGIVSVQWSGFWVFTREPAILAFELILLNEFNRLRRRIVSQNY